MHRELEPYALHEVCCLTTKRLIVDEDECEDECESECEDECKSVCACDGDHEGEGGEVERQKKVRDEAAIIA